MANGDGMGADLMSGFPWWVKAVVIVGVPSAIALGLVWSDRAQLAEAVFSQKVTLASMVLTDAAHDLKVSAKFDALAKQADETNRILLANCVNNARTAEQRERCVGR